MTLSTDKLGKHLEESAGYVFIPLFLFVLNFLLKWIHLDTVQIGLDEPFTLFHAQLPPSEIVEALKVGNNPPLMEVLLHYWMQLFGDSPASVRFPSMLAATLTPVMLFFLGWRLRNLMTGLVAGLAFSLSTEHTYYAHEARVYAIFSCLTVASVWLLLQLRDDPGSKWRWGLLFLVNAAMIWGHYFGFIVLAFESAWVLLALHPHKRKLILGYLLASLAVLLAYLPHLLVLWTRAPIDAAGHWVGPSSVVGLYNVVLKHANQPIVAVLILGVMALGGGISLYKIAHRQIHLAAPLGLLLLLFPGGLLLLYGTGKFFPVFLERYAIFSMSFLYLVVALAMDALPGGWKRWLVGVLLVALMAFTLNLAPNKRSEWKEVAQFLQQERGADEPILVSPKWSVLGLGYHFAPAIFHDPHGFPANMRAAHVHGVMKYTPLDSLPLPPGKAIWVVSAGDPHADLHPSVQRLLDDSYSVAQHRVDWHGITVTEYIVAE